MPRRYRHIKEYEKEIYELKEEGLTNREIAERFGFELKQVKNLITRHNKNQRKLAVGIIKPKGRPRKDGTTLPPSIQQLSKLTQLQYELSGKDRYIKTNNVRVSWVHNGRTMVSENNVIGALLRVLYVGICFDDKLTLEGLYKEVSEQVKNDIRYSCYPYPEAGDLYAESDDVDVMYQANLRDICTEGSLQFTVAEIPTETDCADNLLDVEIHETDEGCKLYMDYNACAYKEESIYRFRKMFIKTACALARNVDNPNICVMDVMERIQ